MDDNNVYREVFFEETDTYLRALNDDVLKLEENPRDIELMNAIFRSAHTLKGMAATMGYDKMAELTHQMENLFDLLKKGEISATHDIISLIFDCLDKLAEIVESLQEGDEEHIDISGLVKKLREAGRESDVSRDDFIDYPKRASELVPELKNYTVSDVKKLQEGISLGYQGHLVAYRLAEDTPMKGVRSFLVLNELQNEGQLVLMEPSESEMEKEDFDGCVNVLILTKQSAQEIEELLQDETDIEAFAVKEALTVLKEPETVKKPEKEKEKQSKKRQSIRVDLGRLDQMMNLVSELVIHRSRLETIAADHQIHDIHNPLEQVERITTELQEVVLELRMQPFKVAVQRFPRMIRDLAGELGKDLKLVIEGEDTELDRTVVAELGEPLIHLLRNAADHGIEMPKDREKAGKPKQGTITVGAYQEGNRVLVTVRDDGKGMDPETIAESAENKGIDTADLSNDEMINLIFHPGFSTKKEVTGVSGRGVGMDVVREKIKSLNGTIEVESVVGEGTVFQITLPLTLSIIQSLLVEAGGGTYAIPQTVIEKVEEFNADALSLVHHSEVYMYNDEYLPVIYLSEALGFDSDLGDEPYVVIVTDRNRFYAVVVDALFDQREIVIKDLGAEIKQLKEYLGATILGNGDVILILDMAAIIAVESGKRYETS